MILSQITRSDVRFELLLCASDAGNLSIVVTSVSQSVVGPGTITVVAVQSISIGFGLSLGRPLAIVVAMSGIGVSGITVVETGVSVRVSAVGSIGQPWVSLSSGLGLSGPLAVVQAMSGIGVSGITVVKTGVGVRVG